jgi:hypothetical protein
MSRRNLTRTIASIHRSIHHVLDGIDANLDARDAAKQPAAPAALCGRAMCARAQRCRRRSRRRCTAKARRARN